MIHNNYYNKIFLLTMPVILTFSILAITSLSFTQASGQTTECQTSLSLNSNPKGGTVASGGTLPVYLLGELKCGDSGIGDATVVISGIDQNIENVVTNEFGKYSLGVLLAPGEYSVQAFFAGDETHVSAAASNTISVNEHT